MNHMCLPENIRFCCTFDMLNKVDKNFEVNDSFSKVELIGFCHFQSKIMGVTGRLSWVRAVLLQWSRFIVFDVTVQAQTCPMEGSNLDCDITWNNARACLDKAGTEGI